MKVLVLGATGMLGSSILHQLEDQRLYECVAASSRDADLRVPDATTGMIREVQPEALILAAARVGGIVANDHFPVQFFDDNMMIQANVLRAAHEADVQRLVFIGSSCTYPRDTPQPMAEDQLWTGPLESTNRAFAAAKLAGYEAIDAYRRQYRRDWSVALMTSLYGPRDNFDLESSHVVPALMRKMHQAKLDDSDVTLWGSGTPKRELMYVDDAARAVIHLLEMQDAPTPINIGVGQDISIRDLAAAIADVVGFSGQIHWDASRPDGTPRKLLNISRLVEAGYRPTVTMDNGLAITYEWMLKNVNFAPSHDGVS